jgi:hypothetical protein
VHAAFAVGWAGVPFEVWALFTSEHEAQRHADAAAYVFRVFALPVYDDYDEVPQWLRPPFPRLATTDWPARVADETTLVADAVSAGEIVPVPPGVVTAAGDFESTGPEEVRLLFTHAADAERYIQDMIDWAAGMQWSEPRPVYASYDDCPAEARHTAPGPALSQHVGPR